jgi:hypothetical protein
MTVYDLIRELIEFDADAEISFLVSDVDKELSYSDSYQFNKKVKLYIN